MSSGRKTPTNKANLFSGQYTFQSFTNSFLLQNYSYYSSGCNLQCNLYEVIFNRRYRQKITPVEASAQYNIIESGGWHNYTWGNAILLHWWYGTFLSCYLAWNETDISGIWNTNIQSKQTAVILNGSSWHHPQQSIVWALDREERQLNTWPLNTPNRWLDSSKGSRTLHNFHLLLPGAVTESVEYESRMREIVGSNLWLRQNQIDTCRFLETLG